MSKRNDFSYIRPLYLFCNIFALLPPHSFGDELTSASFHFKIYALIHIFGVIAIYAHSAYGRQSVVYGRLDVTVRVTDKLANAFLAILNVFLPVNFVFYNSKGVKSFFNKAYEMSKKNHFRCYTRASFWVQFLFFNLYMSFIIAYDAYVWTTTVGIRVFKFYIGRSFLYYLCNVTIFLIFESALLIKDLFASLNDLLELTLKSLVVQNRPDFVTNKSSENLQSIRKHYNKICDIVDGFNGVYGFPILMTILFVISYIINLTDLFMIYAMNSTKNIEGSSYGNNLIVLNILWIITLLVFSFLLAHACANAMSRSENVTAICLTWLNEIPTIPRTTKEQILKEDILLILQQVTARKPTFSAAGFFRVDFTLIGFILGSVTSYIIVSIQFMEA